MKIKPEHFRRLQELLRPVMERAPDVDFSVMRNRWDALWYTPKDIRNPLINEIYEYANDNHIDTALRRILNSSPT